MDENFFRKSSYSHLDCVEAKPLPDGFVQLRDSKNPDGPTHTFTQREWVAFVAGVKEGEFDFGWDVAEAEDLLAAGG